MARRAAPMGLLVVLAAVPGVAIAGLWQYAEANVPPPTTTTTTTLPPPPEDPLATGLFSFRRHPTPLAERVANAAAEAEWAELASGVTELIPEGSCLQLRDGSDVPAEQDPTANVIPASNQKLFVAAVALDILGPDHRFSTELWSAPPVNGVISGNVYLVGGGDPVLRTADVPDPLAYPSFNTTALEPLADQLVALGITTIGGDLVGDGSRYDDEFRAPTWDDEITNRDAGPYDALLVNDGLLLESEYGLNPNQSAARVFLDLVVARGITVVGASANATRPTEGVAPIASIESLPLTDILIELLHTSDNNTAELLVKEIGFQATGAGTRQAGLDTIRATLVEWGVPTDGLLLHDGSGLSRDNRTTCATLTSLLADAPVADRLRAVLPVAGRDGTLESQLLGTEAEGELAAKTGTLTDVKALTGSQPAGDGSPIEFSVVLNGADVDDPEVYEPIWRPVVALIDRYPIVADIDVERFEPR